LQCQSQFQSQFGPKYPKNVQIFQFHRLIEFAIAIGIVIEVEI